MGRKDATPSGIKKHIFSVNLKYQVTNSRPLFYIYILISQSPWNSYTNINEGGEYGWPPKRNWRRRWVQNRSQASPTRPSEGPPRPGRGLKYGPERIQCWHPLGDWGYGLFRALDSMDRNGLVQNIRVRRAGQMLICLGDCGWKSKSFLVLLFVFLSEVKIRRL